jgi:hypothetical protein
MFDVTPLVLAPTARHALERMAADGRRVLGARFVALVAYTASDAALFADTVTAGDLNALGALVETWHREGLATPLVITPSEFRRSLDAFPIEYQAILDRHVVVAGASPFDAAAVPAADLRRACEIQAKSHLIHLREGWLEAAGHESRLAALVARSAAPLRLLLTHLAHLNDVDAPDTAALAAAAHRLAGVPSDLIAAVLALDEAPERGRALVPRLPEYLDACERLWAFIDRWRDQ